MDPSLFTVEKTPKYGHVYGNMCVCVYFNRTPGNKPGSSPRDESGRRHDANSSVSDLANSVTSDMLMVTHNINTVYLKRLEIRVIASPLTHS